MNSFDTEITRRRLERLAWFLDNSIPIPGFNVRIGFDAILGLLPGFGDSLGALASSYILAEAARLGAPKSVLVKMAFNIALDALVGAVPVAGDLFDFAWKANQRNVELLGDCFEKPRKAVFSSWLLIVVLVFLLVALVTGIGLLGYLILRALWNLAGGL